MRRFYRYTSILLFFPFCGSDSQVPENILPPQKMQQVLWDMMRADELTNIYSITDTTAAKLPQRTVRYQQVLQIHQVSREQFKKSLSYYQGRPDLLKIVLDSMYQQANKPPKQLNK